MAIIAEPPALTNGSGRPVTGATPIVMPMLMNTWNDRERRRARPR